MNDLLFSPEQHAHAARLLAEFNTRYNSSLAERAVHPDVDRATLRALINSPLPHEGTSLDALFEEFENVIVPNATHTAHPRFLPYVQPSPNSLSAYADHLAAILNQNCTLWHLSPSANAVEQAVTGWFANLFGLPEQSSGIITSGGSMANLIALTAARDHYLGPNAREQGLQSQTSPLVVYASDETHACIDKAVSVLGLGTNNLRRIPTDDAFRIRLDLLSDAVAADRKSGRTPFCVVGNAGTVTTGAFDPIEELSQFCRTENLWLHIDGAYGALAALSERFREPLSAIGLADSVSLDPHKFLFCAFEAGCVLVRDRAMLANAFGASPSYLSQSEDPDFIDYSNYGPQLSRGFKALKVWWSLKHFGADKYAETIDHMADLAAYLAEQVTRRDGFELMAPVVFNCVCFRLVGLDEKQNEQVLKDLVESGAAFLGPASVKNQRGLRACFMNLRTTEADIDYLLDQLLTIASK
ncbi:MAG: cytochrome D ubiquinol oxidase subunit I [Gammaproteobacteria bacterium]|jgi:aromatic-L-amino-acid/L-tryptophan decarboxylase|nr:cytochrome D ubiquinol oxidase subunit I [Gammaproteobacteria bacterium]MBT4492768.1 cytochrome D ubiquinol oxidase subunit I [Gammaproteobacteria bacterium]